MQTARVTFLTSPGDKAELDAFAASSGRSVGHVLREASRRYIADAQRPSEQDEDEEALALIVPLLEELLPKWAARVDSIERSVDKACRAIDEALAGDPA